MDKDHKKGTYSVQVNQEYALTLKSTDPDVQSIPGGKIDIFLRNIRSGACPLPCAKHGGEKDKRIIAGKDLVNETQVLFNNPAPGVSWTIPATKSSSVSTIIKFTCTNYESEKSRMPWQFCVRTSSYELGASRLNFDLQRVKVLSKQNRLEVLKFPPSENSSKEIELDLEILPTKNASKESESKSQNEVLTEKMDLLRKEFMMLEEELMALKGEKKVE